MLDFESRSGCAHVHTNGSNNTDTVHNLATPAHRHTSPQTDPLCVVSSQKASELIFMDEMDCSNFFDGLLVDFPEDNNDIGGGGVLGGNADTFTSFWPNPNDILPCGHEPGFSQHSSASDLSAELAVPYEEIVHLEWLSNFVEDSFSDASMSFDKVDPYFHENASSNQFQIPSPVSVVESSSSSTGRGGQIRPLSPETPTNRRLGRPRSKRPRPAIFTPRPAIQLLTTPSAAISVTTNTAESRESCPMIKMIKITKPVSDEQHKKKKKIKLLPPSLPTGNADMNQTPLSEYERKCLHCEITKTPQWRAGPMGPKTLCNACGVRHKSGRLFPEYRPAASPTFVPSIHSNSHKKVVEMRTKLVEETLNVMPNPALVSGKTQH